jgi:hypothetical protein
LTTEERATLESRLESEPELRRQLATLRATVELIKNLPPLTAPHDFRVTREMVRERTPKRHMVVFSFASAAAAIALFVIGFQLLTTYLDPTRSAFSNIVNNLGYIDSEGSVAQLPTSTVLASQAPSTELRDGDQAQVGEGQSAAEIAVEQAQQAQGTIASATTTATPSGDSIAAPMLAAPGETDATTIEEFSAADEALASGREQTESLLEAPESVLPLDDANQPTELAASSGLALQASPAPSNTVQPTMMPTATIKPSETASATPTHTRAPTSIPLPTLVPAQSSETAPFLEQGTLGIALIVIALILLTVAVFLFILSRR